MSRLVSHTVIESRCNLDGDSSTTHKHKTMFLKYLFNRATEEAEAAAGGAAAPPVAATVMAGKVSEREADLQAQIDVLKAERDGATGRNVKLEKDIAYLQDKLNALQNPPRDPGKPQNDDDRSDLERFMDGE